MSDLLSRLLLFRSNFRGFSFSALEDFASSVGLGAIVGVVEGVGVEGTVVEVGAAAVEGVGVEVAVDIEGGLVVMGTVGLGAAA